jgi:hypothetical protein
MTGEVEFGYPELEWLQDNEYFVELAHIVKGVERHKLMVRQTINKHNWEEFAQKLKAENDADKVYLTTIEK